MVSVATVVVVGVKLLRRPRVERGRRRWVGVIRRRLLSHCRTILPGVIIMLGTPYTSTLKTQTTPVPPNENVSAPLFVHRARTKNKPDSPRANHAQAVGTALPVTPVAPSLPPVVRPVPMPVVQQPFVIHVVLENTTINTGNRVAQNVLLVNTTFNTDNRVAQNVLLVNTTINKDNRVVPHVVLGNTMNNKNNQVVPHVVLDNTTIKQVKLLVRIAMWENTKTKREKHPATMIV